MSQSVGFICTAHPTRTCIYTVFLLKIRHENNIALISFAEFLAVNIQHSLCMRILFAFIAYTRDDLCRKLETIINHSVKGAE